MEDNKIVDLYWQRSELAITETTQKYGSYCKGIAFNILYRKEDAEECVNDTYLCTWNSIPIERPNYLRAYLGKITRNLSINRYKQMRAKKRGGGEVELLFDELEECIPDPKMTKEEEDAERIAKVISDFLRIQEQESRIIFVRRYWYSDSLGVIAKRYNMSESKVKSMLFRTRKRLRRYLEKEGVTV